MRRNASFCEARSQVGLIFRWHSENWLAHDAHKNDKIQIHWRFLQVLSSFILLLKLELLVRLALFLIFIIAFFLNLIEIIMLLILHLQDFRWKQILGQQKNYFYYIFCVYRMHVENLFVIFQTMLMSYQHKFWNHCLLYLLFFSLHFISFILTIQILKTGAFLDLLI